MLVIVVAGRSSCRNVLFWEFVFAIAFFHCGQDVYPGNTGVEVVGIVT